MTTQVQFRISGAVEDDLRARASAHHLSPGQVVQADWLDLQRMLRDQTPIPAEYKQVVPLGYR